MRWISIEEFEKIQEKERMKAVLNENRLDGVVSQAVITQNFMQETNQRKIISKLEDLIKLLMKGKKGKGLTKLLSSEPDKTVEGEEDNAVPTD